MNQIQQQNSNFISLQRRAEVLEVLEEVCQKLELTATQFDRAKTSYETVGEWLAGSTDPLLANIVIYLQGSGALGTSIRPLHQDEFDIDLIGLASDNSTEVSPAALKKAIGDRLSEHKYYSTILEEKKRCWRLNFSGDFHLDISPTIPNPLCINGGELVPDRKLKTWHPTNPQAFKILFDRRAIMLPKLLQKNIELMKVEAGTVRPFPLHGTRKGILRRTVQILKRHRDCHFEFEAEEIAPISVIITTLAMRSYDYCVNHHVFSDELEVLVETIRMMPHFIEKPILNGQKGYAVWNETTKGENFAERWNSEPKRVNAFFEWHEQALTDIESLRDAVGFDSVINGMKTSFGKSVVTKVINARTEEVTKARTAGQLAVAPLIGLTTSPSAASTPIPQNSFYGD